jgi:hypothetical protein
LEQQVCKKFELKLEASGKTTFASVLESFLCNGKVFRELGDRANHIGQGGKSVQQYHLSPKEFELPGGKPWMMTDLRGFHELNREKVMEYADLLERCYIGKIPNEFLNERTLYARRIKSNTVINDFHQVVFFVIRADRPDALETTMDVLNVIRRSQIPLMIICTHLDKLNQKDKLEFKEKLEKLVEVSSRIYYFAFGDLQNFDPLDDKDEELNVFFANLFHLMKNCEFSELGYRDNARVLMENFGAYFKKTKTISTEPKEGIMIYVLAVMVFLLAFVVIFKLK